MSKIKLLVIVDKKIQNNDLIEQALLKQRQDYLDGTDNELDVTWDYVIRDLSDMTWEDYFSNNYGVSRGWIKVDTKKIVNEHGDKYDSVAYVIKGWTDQGNQNIWGWNLGLFYPWTTGYQIQLIRYQTNVDWLYKTFLMELFHAVDDFYYRKTQKRLEDFFNVRDFDMTIVHGEGVKYESFKYIPVIRQMKSILLELFADKENMNLTKEQLEKLYMAIFHRAADEEGLKYWVGKTLEQFLDGVLDGEEYKHYDVAFKAIKSIENWARNN